MKAMILAAGEGTRLRPYTLRLPKPAIPFLGIPLVQHGIRLLSEIGDPDLVVNHHHLSNEILELFHRPLFQNRKVEFSDEQSALLGSGGGIHKAKSYLKSENHFIVINGDEVLLPHRAGQLREALDSHQSSGRLATLLVVQHPETGGKFGGAWCDSKGEVRQFSKTKVLGLVGWHYVGYIFLSNRVFSYFKPQVVDENILYETLTLAMAKGEKVAVHPLQAEWFETGSAPDFLQATEACVSELLSDQPSAWAKDLAAFLSTQELSEPFVEKDEALLVNRFDQVIKKWGLRKITNP